MEYCLPIRISESVEYQLPMPRPPMLRVPIALTSSSLPALMCGSSASPGDGRESDLAAVVDLAAGVDFPFVSFLSLLSLESLVSAGAGGLSSVAAGCVSD